MGPGGDRLFLFDYIDPSFDPAMRIYCYGLRKRYGQVTNLHPEVPGSFEAL